MLAERQIERSAERILKGLWQMPDSARTLNSNCRRDRHRQRGHFGSDPLCRFRQTRKAQAPEWASVFQGSPGSCFGSEKGSSRTLRSLQLTVQAMTVGGLVFGRDAYVGDGALRDGSAGS